MTERAIPITDEQREILERLNRMETALYELTAPDGLVRYELRATVQKDELEAAGLLQPNDSE